MNEGMNDGTIPRSFRSIFLTHVDKVRLRLPPPPLPSARRVTEKGDQLQEDGSCWMKYISSGGSPWLISTSPQRQCARRSNAARDAASFELKKKSIIFVFREQANGC